MALQSSMSYQVNDYTHFELLTGAMCRRMVLQSLTEYQVNDCLSLAPNRYFSTRPSLFSVSPRIAIAKICMKKHPSLTKSDLSARVFQVLFSLRIAF